MLNDADCGFCMRTARLVPRLGVDIDSSTVQAADLDALGVDAERAVVEMPFVHPDGRVVYGHRAFAAILRTGPLPWRVVGRTMTLPGIDFVAGRTYAWVAANRHRMPGGTAACELQR
jgi:predicted DCC family thiol-disulfide oxidoreductase YuxK